MYANEECFYVIIVTEWLEPWGVSVIEDGKGRVIFFYIYEDRKG